MAVESLVVMVNEGPSAGGIAVEGLMTQSGGVVVTGPDVRAQLRVTGLVKPPVDVRSMVASADPPGSTALRFNPRGMVKPKLCP